MDLSLRASFEDFLRRHWLPDLVSTQAVWSWRSAIPLSLPSPVETFRLFGSLDGGFFGRSSPDRIAVHGLKGPLRAALCRRNWRTLLGR